MDDDVAGVDENPVATLETFDPYILAACFTQSLQEMVGNRRHMAMRTARRDDHIIADR